MTKISIAFTAALALAAISGCKKKGGGDINSVCEDNFAHGEKDAGKWSPGKGDKKAFMDFCLKQKAEVVKCTDMDGLFDKDHDKDCKEHTGVGTPGFEISMKISELRNKPGGAVASGGDKPPGDKPAGDKPAGDKPADNAKPVEKPAADASGSPVAVKDLGKFEENAFHEKKRAFEVKNNGKSVITHLQFYIFHYDKDKKLIDEGGSGGTNAENYPESLGIKPGETKVIPMGPMEGKEPAGTAFVVAALTEVEFADKTSWKNEKDGYPDRPFEGRH